MPQTSAVASSYHPINKRRSFWSKLSDLWNDEYSLWGLFAVMPAVMFVLTLSCIFFGPPCAFIIALPTLIIPIEFFSKRLRDNFFRSLYGENYGRTTLRLI